MNRNENPVQDQPKWWRAGKDFKEIIKIIKIQSRTNLNGGELERILKEKEGNPKIQSKTNLNGGELEGFQDKKEDDKNQIQDQPKWRRAGKNWR